MKSFRLYLFVLLATFLLVSCGSEEKPDPAAYNQAIIDNVGFASLRTEIFYEAGSALPTSAELEALSKKSLDSISGARRKVEELGAFEGDDELRKAALDVIDFYIYVVTSSVELRKQREVRYAAGDSLAHTEAMKQELQRRNERKERVEKAAVDAQNKFLNKYKPGEPAK